MFDYLVLVEFENEMLAYTLSAKKVAKLCASYTEYGIDLGCIRLYRLIRNSDPDPMYFTFNEKLNWLDVYNKAGTLIEGGVRAYEHDHQTCG